MWLSPCAVTAGSLCLVMTISSREQWRVAFVVQKKKKKGKEGEREGESASLLTGTKSSVMYRDFSCWF